MNRPPEREMVFLMPETEHQAIACKVVKEIARTGGNVSKFVPPEVAAGPAAKIPAGSGGK